MTKLEAVLSMPDGYSQAELQFIWEGSPQPINEIMALVDVTRGEARKLWNARKNGEKEFDKYMAVHGKKTGGPSEFFNESRALILKGDERWADFVSGLERGRKPGDVP